MRAPELTWLLVHSTTNAPGTGTNSKSALNAARANYRTHLNYIRCTVSMKLALYPDVAWDCPTAPPSDRLVLNVVTLPSDFAGRLLLLLRRGGFPPEVLSMLPLDSQTRGKTDRSSAGSEQSRCTQTKLHEKRGYILLGTAATSKRCRLTGHSGPTETLGGHLCTEQSPYSATFVYDTRVRSRESISVHCFSHYALYNRQGRIPSVCYGMPPTSDSRATLHGRLHAPCMHCCQ